MPRGESRSELGFDIRHLRKCNGINSRQPYSSVRFHLQLLEAGFKLLLPSENVPAVVEIKLSGRSYRQRTRTSIENLHADLPLDLPNGLAHGRLTHGTQASCLTDALTMRHVPDET